MLVPTAQFLFTGIDSVDIFLGLLSDVNINDALHGDNRDQGQF